MTNINGCQCFLLRNNAIISKKSLIANIAICGKILLGYLGLSNLMFRYIAATDPAKAEYRRKEVLYSVFWNIVGTIACVICASDKILAFVKYIAKKLRNACGNKRPS